MAQISPSAVTIESDLEALEDVVLTQVREWLDAAAEIPSDASAAQLASLLRDPAGLPFAVGFIDGVIRPEDVHVAARALRDLTGSAPSFLPLHLRAALRGGRLASRVAPGVVVPVARRALRSLVSHLVIDARDAHLGRAINRLRTDGVRLNLNLLGEAVLGEHEAARRLEGTRRLLARDDVDHVSVKVSSLIGPHSPWAHDEAVAHVVEKLTPLYEFAAASPTPKFINLDMEEYRDLALTMDVFTRLLERPALRGLEAGIVLQAYLPDALGAMVRLQEWAARRRAEGGASIKVRLVKGANLPMERVDAELHGWPLATWSSKQESDTHYKQVLHYALTPERVANVRVGVAGHNLFDVAHAWVLAGRRDVRNGVEFEMLLGMAQSQAEAVRRTVGSLLLYTPVVHPDEFDVAIAYLVRRLEEGASSDNFMSAVFDLAADEELLARESARFSTSLHALDAVVPGPRRTQDRREPPAGAGSRFANAPDTDPSLPGNRVWGRAVLARSDSSTLGTDLVAAHTLTTVEQVDDTVGGAVAAAEEWAARTPAERGAVLRRAADELERRRGELAEVMASECGKTLEQSDPEISEAIDFARYYAQLGEELADVDGAVAVPVRLTVVTPPWNFPVAIPAGSTLAALAAGSAVVLKPAGEARRCGSVLADALWTAGVPREVLRLVHLGEGELGRALVADPRVDRLILTGAYGTAELFRTFRADLPLLAETSGKNAVVITPSADLDLAAKDVAGSAFGHAGQKCSAASLVILVGSVAESKRFHHQLLDAVRSLHVGFPSDPQSQMGPLTAPAEGKLLHALTTLEPGETWLVEPERLDTEGRLWSPGVRTGVHPGSPFHLTEYFGPVLGIMRAESLDEAISLQNAVDYGLTAGLHSLDPDEIATWLAGVKAGNLYVNRGITGAIVRRQPFGGWKKSAVGTGAKAGGKNYLHGLVDWRSAPSRSAVRPDASVAAFVTLARTQGVPEADLARLERAQRSDAQAWAEEFSVAADVTGLTAERNVFRHLSAEVCVRARTSAPLADVLRVLSAGQRAGATLHLSLDADPGAALRDGLTDLGVDVTVADDPDWYASLTTTDVRRFRLVGVSAAEFAAATGGRPDFAAYAQPVTEAGRVEMLPFLLEQSVSITAHRFGTPRHGACVEF